MVSSPKIANNDGGAKIDFSEQQQQKRNGHINSDNSCSRPQKRKRFFNKRKKKKDNKYQRSVNGKTMTVSHPRATVRRYNTLIVILFLKMRDRKMKKETNAQVTKEQSFIWIYQCFKNAKSQPSKLHLVEMETHDAYHKWFEIYSAAGIANLMKPTSAKQLTVLVDISHRKIPRANISYIFTYIYSMCQKILICCSKRFLQEQN